MSQPYTQEDYQTQEDRKYYDQQLESAEERDEIMEDTTTMEEKLEALFELSNSSPF